ncbi:MAG: MarC family protein [Desulfurococcaceae archaeon]
MDQEIVLTFVAYFTQLLAIMNPFSVVPTFITLTEGLSKKEVNAIVRKATIAGLIIVIVFAVAGKYILEAFNVSIAGLRVAGGIVLMTIALDMLGEEPRTKRMDPKDIAVVPIATPLIIGPGTITTILLLVSSKPGDLVNHVLVLVAGILACLISFGILRISEYLVKVLRTSTIRAIGRFMALIIAGVAVEMIVHGVQTYYVTLFSNHN